MQNPSPRFQDRLALLLLLLLAGVMFVDLLFSTERVLSAPNTDLASQFIPWREFAARELQSGNLPLWNPHLFSGAPYLGGFQAALLYPPNLVFLAFPTAMAMNLSIALHVYLIGAFMFLWGRGRGLSTGAAFLSGALMMFAGAFFPHIYAGHLPNLCTMAWVPLLFLAIDRIFDHQRWSGALIGMGALAMMILAGHPQYVFFTAVAAGIYTVLRWAVSRQKGRTALLLSMLVVGGAALAAAQLGAGLQASSETVRSGGLPIETARMFSFPPENFVTLLAPGFFGPMNLYWGRCYLWEMALFISATGAILAFFAVIAVPVKTRRWAVTMVALLLLLALGSHTPLFSFLYHYVPGFNAFRGWSKFTFQATLFLVLLSGYGFDELRRRGRAPLPLTLGTAILGFILLIAGIGFQASGNPGGWISGAMKWAISTRESYLAPQAAQMSDVVAKVAGHAGNSCWLAGGALLLTAGALAMMQENRRWLYAIAGIAVAEAFIFSFGTRESFEIKTVRQPAIEEFFAKNPGDYRTFNLQPPNLALSLGTYETWGYDPGVVKRYAEWMFFTQEADPNQATQYLPIKQIDRLYAPLLRARFAFIPEDGQLRIASLGETLPHLFLAGEYRVIPDRDAIFRAMAEKSFNPGKEVILEQEPIPKPEGVQGEVRLVGSTTDSLTIEADLPQAALLVITDLWTSGWRVRDLDGKQSYQLLPADYILRAVPLSAGQHRLIVEYSPTSWRVGVAISLVALCAYGMAWGAVFKKRQVQSGS